MTTDQIIATTPKAAGGGRRVLPRARWGTALAAAAVLSVATAGAASAADDFDLKLRKGLACPGFALGLNVEGGNLVSRQFVDKDGNTVTLLAGDGVDLTFTNLTTGESVTVRTPGTVTHTTSNADGSVTAESTGHNVIILFPKDDPPGPSTTLYTGRIVYTIEGKQVFTVQSVSGDQLDICAVLA